MRKVIPEVLRQPIDATNSTVLGSRVKADSVQWVGLDWTKVRTDSGPHAFHPEASGYLHVGYCFPGDKPEGLQYRVRYIKRIGDRLKIGSIPVKITSIWPHQRDDGRWEWVVGIRRIER